MENVLKSEELSEVDSKKREFIKKFGKYAMTAPVGMMVMMTPSASAHASSSVDEACDSLLCIDLDGEINLFK
jgi:hypothetical protein